MKSKTKQVVKSVSLDNLNIESNQILSNKQLKVVAGGDSTEAATLAATIRAANS